MKFKTISKEHHEVLLTCMKTLRSKKRNLTGDDQMKRRAALDVLEKFIKTGTSVQ